MKKNEEYFLFLNAQNELKILDKVFKSPGAVRVFLHSSSNYISHLNSKKHNVWIDAGLDGFPVRAENSFSSYYEDFEGYDEFNDPSFLISPKKKVVEKFINSILDKCLLATPSYLSVPQIYHEVGTSHNKINKMICKVFAEWKIKNSFTGKAILPVVFTHKDAIIVGANRTSKIKTIEKLYNEANADGVWIVDSSLQDQSGTGNFEKVRFPAMIDFHKRIQEGIQPEFHLAGPYWGMNMILWARNIITTPGITLGAGYCYYRPGSFITPSKFKRIAVPPLKRWCISNNDLKSWLKDAKEKTVKSEDKEIFSDLHSNMDQYNRFEKNKEQISQFYYDWYKSIEKVPKAGRSLTLFQQFTDAYVVGMALPDLKGENGRAKKPGLVANQFMLNCL